MNGDVDRDKEDQSTYSCDRGFKLEGDAVLKCSSKGKWQGHAPRCKGESGEDETSLSLSFECYSPSFVKGLFIFFKEPQDDHAILRDLIIFMYIQDPAYFLIHSFKLRYLLAFHKLRQLFWVVLL